jgi:hypothetical protein
MPVVVCQVHDYRHQHRESLFLVALKDVQKVVVLKEAHSSVSNLQVNSANASDYALKQFGHEVLDFVNFAYLKDLLEFCKEESLFDAVCIWPVAQETVQECNSE